MNKFSFKIFPIIFIAFTVSTYGINAICSDLIYKGKRYRIAQPSEISLGGDKGIRNRVIIKFNDIKISKKLKKITKYGNGYALIEKNKARIAIPCLDLALHCSVFQPHFTEKMEDMLFKQKREHYDILALYFAEETSLKATLALVMAAPCLFKHVHETKLFCQFSELCRKIVENSPERRGFLVYLENTYKQLLDEYKSQKNIDLFLRFAEQLEALSTLNPHIKGIKLSVLFGEFESNHIIHIINNILDIYLNNVVYFLWIHKHIVREQIPQDLILHIISLYYKNLKE